MLDFTKTSKPSALQRCQQRAGLARKAAGTMGVVLVGLVGAALIREPALVDATQSGVGAVQASVFGGPQAAPAETVAFSMPVDVATMAIGADADIVAQNDVDLLGDLDGASSQ